MSAFIVGEEHIRYLVNAALSFKTYGNLNWYSHGTAAEPPRQLGAIHEDGLCPCRERPRLVGKAPQHCPSCPESIGAMLWRENYASVNARYSESDAAPVYTHKVSKVRLDPVQVLKAISCYEYQSCEHNGWYESEARAFCDALRDRMISNLQGYDGATWEVSEQAATAMAAKKAKR